MLQRIGELLNIYFLLYMSSSNLNKCFIQSKIKENGIDIQHVSTYERMLRTNSSKIVDALVSVINNREEWKKSDISVKDILEAVNKFLFVLRT
jgi:hypothetical protein